ncbi:MAG: nucleotidyltransferase domain-containing protein [Clostridiales bacterium]|nr:nucleotidyltransferase domain-containing protein [Clostridiales bacterium]
MLLEDAFVGLVEGLCKIFKNNIQQVILYGSVARQEASEDSDVDIAIILGRMMTAEERKEFLELVSYLDMKYERVFSVIDIDENNMKKWGRILPFYKNIQEEGIVLWKAA